MHGALDYVNEWSQKELHESEQIQTQVMEIIFSLSGEAHPLILECEIIEKDNTVKLLGVYIQEDLKWNTHVNQIVIRESQRLRFMTVSI